MGKQMAGHLDHEDLVGVSSTKLRMGLLEAAGGDSALADGLRAVMWQEYCAADRPFGPSEEGMLLWLAHEQYGCPQ